MPAELSMSLPRDRASARTARDAVRRHLGYGHERTSDLLLVVTELVANAVVHGRGRITLTVCIDGGRIQGEVLDEGSGFEPEKRQRGVHHRRGGGLAIVDALSNGWGVLEGTTHVWFELRSPGESTTASALA